jgi:membrane-associated PAP2 superfamily phosphatase
VYFLGPYHFSFSLSKDFITINYFNLSDIPLLPSINVPGGIFPSGHTSFKFNIKVLLFLVISQTRASLPIALILFFKISFFEDEDFIFL